MSIVGQQQRQQRGRGAAQVLVRLVVDLARVRVDDHHPRAGAACLPGAAFLGGYVLLPNVRAGVLGDISVDGENAVTFSLTGAYTKGGNAW